MLQMWVNIILLVFLALCALWDGFKKEIPMVVVWIGIAAAVIMHAFDIIEGGIANDSVIDTVDAYMSGLIDGSTALGKLMYNKPNNQICILNQKIIEKCVRFFIFKNIMEVFF